MNHAFFAKVIENVRKYSDIKPAKTKLKRNYLISARNYHTTKTFSQILLITESKKSTDSNE